MRRNELMIYIHKNLIKKAKRDKQLIDLIIAELEDVISTALVIEQGIYKGKLCGKYGLVLDMPLETDCYILWETVEDKGQFELSTTIFDYEQQQATKLIAGNQFIKFDDELTTFKEQLLDLLDSKQLELKYVLDEQQSFILEQAQNFLNIAYTGNAGSGKTLLLNRIAHDLLEAKRPFLYLTYTASLKEKFASFLSNAVDSQADIAHIFTFEQLLRDQIAPSYGVEASDYASFLMCEQFTKRHLTKVEQELGLKTLLSMKEIARILMTIPTFELDITDPKKKLAAPNIIIERKLASLVETKKASTTAADVKILTTLSAKFEVDLKKQKKKPWYLFLNELNIAANNQPYKKPYAYILLDEMQDLGQFEFMLLIKILGDDPTTRYIITYDENQRIAFEGSTDRSFQKRIELLKIEPTLLRYNYRNATNIKQLAKHFITEQARKEADDQSNLNLSKVKVVVNPDMEHFISQLVTKFIPEENLNIGIVAFGQTYTDYYDVFYTDTGKSKYIGIDFYNEEDIKGLEYTNLIILNFFELCKTEKPISPMELRKWYVAITRACDNLLVHVRDEDEYEYAKQQLKQDFFQQDYIKRYDVFEDCLEHFNADILISLGNEQKNILAQEGYRLLKGFLTSYSLEMFDEAVSIFKRIDMQETLKNLLEIEFQDLKQHQAVVALELCKIAISEQHKELFVQYLPYVQQDFIWQLQSMFTEQNLLWEHLLPNDFKSKKVVLEELNTKGKELKINKRYDDYIHLYYRYGVYRNIIITYEELTDMKLQQQSYTTIARAYVKQGMEEKATELYLQHGELDEVIRLYSTTGQYDAAFEEIYKMLDQQVNEHYIETLFELAMKTKEQKEHFLKRLLALEFLSVPYQLKVIYELFLMHKEQTYAEQGIVLATKYKMNDFILRFYYQNRALAAEFPIIAEALRTSKRFRELAQLYNEQGDYGQELLALVSAYRHHSPNLEGQILSLVDDMINDYLEGDFTEILKEVLPEVLEISKVTVHRIELAVDTLLYLGLTDKAITLAYEHELYDFVILIADTYEGISDLSLVTKAHEQLNNFNEAAQLHKKEGRVQHAISFIPDTGQKLAWVREQFDILLPKLAANLDNLQKTREHSLASILQLDFAYSGKTNFELYCEQTLKQWLDVAQHDMRPLDYLLIDSQEAADQVITHFSEVGIDEGIILYYKNQTKFCQQLKTLERVLIAVVKKGDLAFELDVRQRLLKFQLRLMPIEDLDDHEAVWNNVEHILKKQTLHKVEDFAAFLKPLVQHQSYMPHSIQLKLARYICLIEQIELPKKTTVKSMENYFDSITAHSFYKFLNKFAYNPAPPLLHALLNKVAVLLEEQFEKLLSHQQALYLKAQEQHTNMEQSLQKLSHDLTMHLEYGRIYAETDKLVTGKDAPELIELYMQELEGKYGELLVQNNHTAQQSLPFVIEQEIYLLLREFVTTKDEAALRNQIRRRIRQRKQTSDKSKQEISRLQDELKLATTSLNVAKKEMDSLESFLRAVYQEFNTLLARNTKTGINITFSDLEEDARHPLFQPYLQLLREQEAQLEAPIEEEEALDVVVEGETQMNVDELIQTDAILEPLEEINHSVQVKTMEVEVVQQSAEPIVLQPEPTLPEIEKIEQVTSSEQSINEVDAVIVERIRTLQSLVEMNQPTMDASIISNIVKLPVELVELYMSNRSQFTSYYQLLVTLNDEQIELLSAIQPLSVEQLKLIKCFQLTN